MDSRFLEMRDLPEASFYAGHEAIFHQSSVVLIASLAAMASYTPEPWIAIQELFASFACRTRHPMQACNFYSNGRLVLDP